MRNGSASFVSRFDPPLTLRIPHSAFRIRRADEGPPRRRWYRGASHARTRPGPGPARRGEGNRARARRRRAWNRSRRAAALSVPPSPPADGADLPAHLVEQRALVVDRRTRLARGRTHARRRATGDRDRNRRLRFGPGGVARAAARP